VILPAHSLNIPLFISWNGESKMLAMTIKPF
jgi:hypothetical protein